MGLLRRSQRSLRLLCSQKVPPGEVEGPGRSLLEELVSFCRIPLPEVPPEEVEEPQGSRPEEGGGTGGPLPFRSWKVPPEEAGNLCQ
jgi:hypothetical protein